MKIALKVLAQSDVSLFDAHKRLSKQRSMSLHDEVFVKRFYPGLQGSPGPVIFPLVITGPGGRAAHELTRMAMRAPGVKNWLITGESIHDPIEEPGRYGKLAENDFAIMAFEGHDRPRFVMLILVSAAEDAELHAAIADRFELPAHQTMREVSGAAVAHLRSTTTNAYTSNEHPLDSLLSIVETDQQGKELFEVWLTGTGHEEGDFKWLSQFDARAAYDHEVYAARWLDGAPHVFVAVKPTRMSFEWPIHMSMAEVRFAARTENYRIARLYHVDGATPKLRILTGVQNIAARVIGGLGALPHGVTTASLQLDPGLFTIELEAKL